MVRLGRAALHQLISHRQWKRNVDEAVAVDMADFAATNAELCATKTV